MARPRSRLRLGCVLGSGRRIRRSVFGLSMGDAKRDHVLAARFEGTSVTVDLPHPGSIREEQVSWESSPS